MKTTGNIKELRTLLKKESGKVIALVPTMGYLHSGHMKLVERAKHQADIVVVSIFVNPLQFGPGEDFEHYPRDLKRDFSICREHGVDYIFSPSIKEMYPKALEIDLQLNHMSSVLDGVSRPGHFEGVVTVVNKLLNIIEPDYVTFGEKDRQQLMIVERMIEDFNHDVEILSVATEREDSGLAKSSRNVNLTAQEHIEAVSIYESLKYGKSLIEAGISDTTEIKENIQVFIESRISGAVDHVDIYSYPDLKEVTNIQGSVVIFVAVQFCRTRLIDNILVKK